MKPFRNKKWNYSRTMKLIPVLVLLTYFTGPLASNTPYKSIGDINKTYGILIKTYRKEFAAIRLERDKKKINTMNFRTFLDRGRITLAEWDAARTRLLQSHNTLGRIERQIVRVQIRRARLLDKKTGNFKNLKKFFARNNRRVRRRNRDVARLQKIIDSNAARLNQNFKKHFHRKLNTIVQELDRRKAPQKLLLKRRDLLVKDIDAVYIPRNRLEVSRKKYLNYWVNYFFSKPIYTERTRVARTGDTGYKPPLIRVTENPKKREPIAKEPGKKQPVRVPTRKPAKNSSKNPEKKPVAKHPAKEPVTKAPRSKEPGKKQPTPKVYERKTPGEKVPEKIIKEEPKLRPGPPEKGCTDCNLKKYLAFLKGLSRSCYDSNMPDILIKECYRTYVTVNLTSPLRKEIFHFLKFYNPNYNMRRDGLSYFEENCLNFKPAIELGERILKDRSYGLNIQQRLHMKASVKYLKACPAITVKTEE